MVGVSGGTRPPLNGQVVPVRAAIGWCRSYGIPRQGRLQGQSGTIASTSVIPARTFGVSMTFHRTRTRPSRNRSRGQSLAEFALVFPVLMLIVGGIIQFGIIFWGQNTLTQVARDIGRYASTQVVCPTTANTLGVANNIAQNSSLIGYTTGSWTAANLTVSMSGDPCPVTDNTQVAYVSVAVTHQVPIFFPFVPGNGTITTSAQFRMEPNP